MQILKFLFIFLYSATNISRCMHTVCYVENGKIKNMQNICVEMLLKRSINLFQIVCFLSAQLQLIQNIQNKCLNPVSRIIISNTFKQHFIKCPPLPKKTLFFQGRQGVIFLKYFHEVLGLGHKKSIIKCIFIRKNEDFNKSKVSQKPHNRLRTARAKM